MIKRWYVTWQQQQQQPSKRPVVLQQTWTGTTRRLRRLGGVCSFASSDKYWPCTVGKLGSDVRTTNLSGMMDFWYVRGYNNSKCVSTAVANILPVVLYTVCETGPFHVVVSSFKLISEMARQAHFIHGYPTTALRTNQNQIKFRGSKPPSRHVLLL